MDPIAKRTLAICTAIIAAPKLASIAEENRVALRDAIYDSILRAETILNQLNARWPDGRVPGK